MPINRLNQKTFHRTLYSGMLQTITLLKRGDNQQQGTVTSYEIHQCRRSMQHKHGETIGGEMQSDHRTVWHIPRIELERLGIFYFNPADRFVENWGYPQITRTWQPESPTMIDIKLFEVHVCVACLLVSAVNG